jgi:hypothetical protein
VFVREKYKPKRIMKFNFCYDLDAFPKWKLIR